MNKLIFKIILIGLLLGAISTSVTMLLGFALYYAITSLEIVLFSYFLQHAAWVSLAVGVLSIASWYIYVLAIARKYFLRIIDQFVDDLKQVPKR